METPSRSDGYDDDILYRCVLEPQRSASARNINTAIIVFALAALPVSLVFGAMGAWPVSIFVGLDVILLAAALRLHYWSGRSCEVITITHDRLTVDRVGALGRQKRIWQAEPFWLRVDLHDIDDHRNRLELRVRNDRTEIGRFLTADEKASLAAELRYRVSRMSAWQASTI